MNTIFKTFAAGVITLASASAFALPTGGGSISFSSDGTPFTWTNTDPTDGVGSFDFAEADNGAVDGVSGDFVTYFSVGNKVQFHDFSYIVGTPASPIDIWTSNSITFQLTSIAQVFETTFNGIDDVTIFGSGLLNDGTVTSTASAVFKFNAGQGGTLSWDSNTLVPEPAPLALLGLGLVGVALARRGQKA